MSYHEAAYNKINSEEPANEAEWTHQLLAGGAAFEAMRLYNKKQQEEGVNPENDHHLAKELLAGFVGVAVDRIVETKGADWVDKQKAKHHAKEEAEKLYSEQTGFNF
ncbi:hypothetical protein K501DRAFT_198834 [Backusella circina FSU 941]|nr:hypothetical protein K501DRAFT_198834 [Backusella circina FSU 941]